MGRVIESEAWLSVQDATAKVLGAKVLQQEPFDRVVRLVIERFLRDSDSAWWWTRLNFQPAVVPYSGSDEFFPMLRRLAPGEERAILLVMNDNGVPDGAIEGSFESLVSVMEDAIGFEFIILQPTGEWAIFDTHHNELLIAGNPGSNCG